MRMDKLENDRRAIQRWILREAMDGKERGKHSSLESLQKKLMENPTAYMYIGSAVDKKGRLYCMTHGGEYVEIPASFWALPKEVENPVAKLDQRELEKALLENPLKYMRCGEDGGIWCMCYSGSYVRVGEEE
jgi:hypothetical protein